MGVSASVSYSSAAKVCIKEDVLHFFMLGKFFWWETEFWAWGRQQSSPPDAGLGFKSGADWQVGGVARTAEVCTAVFVSPEAGMWLRKDEKCQICKLALPGVISQTLRTGVLETFLQEGVLRGLQTL